ncbi:hypothetical protein [Cryptosporangium aurantiacum]|uniref:Uncharacterized protein n=1 Tax=Cryptosporangium aurantiacum TaxID=134849 RepID=A0A1M7REU8_9ACTN|nr:hypothetical protein [Cryptosporangium aurantiacum]SHN44669.1 hypothetical protein SAMN05443668_110315 [Cryptosporangium aurantiacum]
MLTGREETPATAGRLRQPKALPLRPMLTVIVDIEPIRSATQIHTVGPMNRKPAHLKLAVLLGFLGLARPTLSIVGAYDSGFLAKPVGPLLLTALISAVWIAAAVWRRVHSPVLTLTAAGVAYALFAILLNLSLQPFLASAEPIPPPGYIAILIFNALQGAVLGLIAWAILQVRTSSRARQQ